MITKYGPAVHDYNSFNATAFPKGRGETGFSVRNMVFESVFALPRDAATTVNHTATPTHKLKQEVQFHLCGFYLAKQHIHAIQDATRILGLANKANDLTQEMARTRCQDAFDIALNGTKNLFPLFGAAVSDKAKASLALFEEEYDNLENIKAAITDLNALS